MKISVRNKGRIDEMYLAIATCLNGKGFLFRPGPRLISETSDKPDRLEATIETSGEDVDISFDRGFRKTSLSYPDQLPKDLAIALPNAALIYAQ